MPKGEIKMSSLVFDLVKGMLGSFKLNEPLSKEFQGITVRIEGDGYDIGVIDGNVRHISAYFLPIASRREIFDGDIIINNKRIAFDCNKSSEFVKSLLGTPSDSWNDGSEESVVYQFGDIEVAFSWDISAGHRLYFISCYN